MRMTPIAVQILGVEAGQSTPQRDRGGWTERSVFGVVNTTFSALSGLDAGMAIDKEIVQQDLWDIVFCRSPAPR